MTSIQAGTSSANAYSELQDESRKTKIKNLAKKLEELRIVPRGAYFYFWFANHTNLHGLLKMEQGELQKVCSEALRTLNDYDLAGVLGGGASPKSQGPEKRSAEEPSDLAPTDQRGRKKKAKAEDAAGVLSGRSSNIPSPSRDAQMSDVNQAESKLSDNKLKQADEKPKEQPQKTAKVRRSSPMADLAKKRDGDQCLLTKRLQPTLHASHIVPFKMHKTRSRRDVWKVLKLFWGDLADKCEQELLDSKTSLLNTERVDNFLTLEIQSHFYWDQPYIAFRPVSMNAEKTSMTLEVHWIMAEKDEKDNEPLPRREDLVDLEESLYTDDFIAKIHDRIGARKIYHQETNQIIRSGDTFVVTTKDPKTMPLPSWHYLTLLWHTKRIVAMQGKGEDEDLDSDSDDDKDKPAVPSRDPSPEKRGRPLDRENSPFNTSGPYSRQRDTLYQEKLSIQLAVPRLAQSPDGRGRSLSRKNSPYATSRSCSYERPMTPNTEQMVTALRDFSYL